MREFTTHVTIAAAPARVWAIMTDVVHWPEWTASIRSVEHLDAEPLRVGSRVRIEQPKLRPAVWTVTDWQPQRSFTWESKNPGIAAVGLHAVEAVAEGSRVTLTVRFDGWLAPLIALLAGGLTRTYIAMEAAGLKARCEAAG